MITPVKLLRLTSLILVAYAVINPLRHILVLPQLEVTTTADPADLVLWLTPILLLALLALSHPHSAAWLLACSTLVLLGMQAWIMGSGERLGSLAPAAGRSVLLATFALALLAAILGLQRPMIAGLILVLVAIAPMAATIEPASLEVSSLAAALQNAKLMFGIAGGVLVAGAVLFSDQRLPTLHSPRRHDPKAAPPFATLPGTLPARFSTNPDDVAGRPRWW